MFANFLKHPHKHVCTPLKIEKQTQEKPKKLRSLTSILRIKIKGRRDHSAYTGLSKEKHLTKLDCLLSEPQTRVDELRQNHKIKDQPRSLIWN